MGLKLLLLRLQHQQFIHLEKENPNVYESMKAQGKI